MHPNPKQVIQIGARQIELPDGVTVTEWALEKQNSQNPRIRAFMGCIRLLEGVYESNYAILHCSPERLQVIWSKVREVTTLIRTQLSPLLTTPSKIPLLEQARLNAKTALHLIGRDILANFDSLPGRFPPDRHKEIRKTLCISMGQLHAFLQDTFGEFMSADPRSLHDSDYFISRRFTQDIEEAEWLHTTVEKLQLYLQGLEKVRATHLTGLVQSMRRDNTLPSAEQWEETSVFLNALLNGLIPKLKEILALRGIRFYELEILDRYSTQIPAECQILIELYDLASEGALIFDQTPMNPHPERRRTARIRTGLESAVSGRMVALMASINQTLRDLCAFIPLWLGAIEKRRALLLKKEAGQFDGLDELPPTADTAPD